MVIIASKEGQLANRIFHASNFIANAKEHQYHIKHLFFDDYYSFFSESLGQNRSLISFFSKKSGSFSSAFRSAITFFVKVFLKLKIKKLPFIEIIDHIGYSQDQAPFDLNDEKFIKKARSKIVFVYGWLFADVANRNKYKQYLVSTWQPNKIYQDNIKNYIRNYKSGCDILIGVHIRGGDYKKFEGGKWFYTSEQYYEKMKELSTLKIFEGMKIAYVICTNEKNISFPTDENFIIFNEERHFVEDLYLLSKCDYIIGPPSTFSGWASFYGEVPLLTLKDISIKIDGEFFQKTAVVLNS
jgi:hypothetical protein